MFIKKIDFRQLFVLTRSIRLVLIGFFTLSLVGCFSQYNPPKQYALTAVSDQQLATKPVSTTLLVSQTVSVLAYQSNEMLYVDQNYQLEPFVKNIWNVPPAEMLFPLITQSLQNTHYFAAVIPSPTFAYANWRIDSQVMKLQQDFTRKPSVVELQLNVTLIDSMSAHIIASKQFYATVPASSDTPYGGVMAANLACKQIMDELSVWVVNVARQAQ